MSHLLIKLKKLKFGIVLIKEWIYVRIMKKILIKNGGVSVNMFIDKDQIVIMEMIMRVVLLVVQKEKVQ